MNYLSLSKVGLFGLLLASTPVAAQSTGSAHLRPQIQVRNQVQTAQSNSQGLLRMDEGADAATVRLRLSSPSTSWVQVDLASTGTAELGTDFLLSETSVAFAPGDIEETVTVTAIADDLAEGLETAQLTMTRVRGTHSPSISVTDLQIVDRTVFPLGVPGVLLSDDFSHCDGLQNLWTVYDPIGDASIGVSGVGIGNAVLDMSVPAGVEHQAYNALFAPHVMQPLAGGDFEVEVHFTDRPDNEEDYGLLIKQSDARWLRFDFYGSGGNTYLYTGRTHNGRTSNRGNWSIPGTGGGLWMRVARSGNTWTLRSSTDGTTWVLHRTYSHSFSPVEIGPFLGNFGSLPAADMSVDYVFDVLDPISPEDVPGGAPVDLTLQVLGSGAVTADPPGGSYNCGTLVTLTAQPQTGWEFSAWSGDASGTNPALQVLLNSSLDITANFTEVSTGQPPVLTNVLLEPTPTTANVSWTTDVPADSQVDYGLTTALGNTVFNGTYVTQHALQLNSLLPGNTYHIQVSSLTPAGVRGEAGAMTLVTPNTGPVVVSDDFNDCATPASLWTAVDPTGSAEFSTLGAGTNAALLKVAAPAGTSYEAFGSLDLPYLWQPMADGDFEIVEKLQTVPGEDRSAGILFIDDVDNWFSVELYRDAGVVQATGVFTQGGSSARVFDTPAQVGTSAWIKVIRAGNDWDILVSDDGIAFALVRSLTFALDQNQLGLYAGNLGTLPIVDARIDYLEEVSDALTPEDGPLTGITPRVLVVSPAPVNGAITTNPVFPSYSCLDVLTVEAVADPGYLFTGWTGDLSGSANPTTLAMDQDRSVSATFALINQAPVISNVAVTPGTEDAIVTWTTDLPATSLVAFGLDNSYGNQVSSSALVTAHQLVLTGLSAETLYHFQVTSAVGSGASDQSADDVFTTLDPTTSVVVSDDFSGCSGLGPQWTFVDSANQDGQFAVIGTGTGDAQLTISVPAGVERQNYNSLGSPRVVQPVADVDFQVEMKFDSEVTAPYQIQGLLVLQDSTNWLRFDVYSSPAGPRYFAGSTTNGSTAQRGDGALAMTAPYYLRVQRTGNQWAYSLSDDGVTYQLMASFSRSLGVTELGPYAGNAFSGGVSPAFTASCDYFFDSQNPLIPEDGQTGGSGPYTVITSVPGGGGSIQRTPDQSDYSCGEVLSLTPQPDAGFLFSGWAGDASGVADPLSVTVTGDLNIMAVFTADTGDPVISNVQVSPTDTAATITWDTVDPADGTVTYGPTTGLGSSSGHVAELTQHSVVLTGLNPATTYFFQVNSQDSSGGSTTEPIDSFVTLPTGSITSDDFHEPNLNLGLWTFTDPNGVAQLRMVGSGTSDARVEIEIPSGTAYEPYFTNGAARLTQPVADEDFTFQAKFENPITSVNTSTGIFVEKDIDDWIRLDYYFDGTNLNVFSSRFSNGSPGSQSTAVIQAGPWVDDSPLYLRIIRVNNGWTTQYSLDGVAWTTVRFFGFALIPERVGILCGNSSAGPEAQTVAVDWFESSVTPIANEDPAVGADGTVPYLYDVDSVALSENAIQISWATDEPTTGQVQWGTTSAYGQAPAISSQSGYQHTVTLVGLTMSTEYHFQVESTDLSNNTFISADQTQTTADAPNGNAPMIDFWYGMPDTLTGAHNLSFGTLGNAQSQFNVIGRVLDADQDRIALEVTLKYRINSGPWVNAALGDDRTINYAPWRLANEGDFNIELFISELIGGPLVNGVHINTVEFEAEDDSGNISQMTAIVDYTPNVIWTDTMTIDWSQVASQNNGSVESVAQVVDGLWEVHDHPTLGHVLRPDPTEHGYDRVVAIGEGSGPNGWDNYEVLLPVTVHSLDPQGYTAGTSSYAMGFIMRWTGHTQPGPYNQPNHGLYPLGALWIFRWFNSNERWELWIDENEAILPQVGNDISLGVTNWYRLRCEDAPGGGTAYAFKVWPDGQAEPSAWTFEHTTNAGDPPRGSLLLVSHHADVSFGNIVINHLP